MRFRATELSVRLAMLTGAGWLALVGSLVGCEANTSGSATSKRHPDPVGPVPGIVPTQPDHIPPEANVCAGSPVGDGEATQQVLAAVADPAAPRITVSVPRDWKSIPGTGDTALMSSGPDTLAATVTIAATDLTPESAFLRHNAAVGGNMTRRKFSVTGSPFCGYSSQQLSGTLQGPSGGIDFADRVTHIWTNTKQYLVTIHLEARSGAPGFNAAKSTWTRDFAVVIP